MWSMGITMVARARLLVFRLYRGEERNVAQTVQQTVLVYHSKSTSHFDCKLRHDCIHEAGG